MAVTYTISILITLGLCAATFKICPEISLNSTHNAFGTVNYVQRGLWQQLPCPSYRPNETISRVIWFKQDSRTTPTQTLITHKRNADYPESDRYAFGTSGFSLVIKGVEESDEGTYLCQLIPRDTKDRIGQIVIQMIGDTFPGGNGQSSSTATFQRGRRQMLRCECASQTPDVVYWSTGEGVTTDTQIIGARFSDGATLQIQHGADYSIGSDASLTINSLNDVQDTQRFWCHVFQSDGTVKNCNIDVQISDEVESARDALKASERSFYLRNDTQQILPCLSWTPGDTACEVEWSKLDNPDRQVLRYSLSTGVIDSISEFDLASEFGLAIQLVDDAHAGVYRCAVGDENQIDVEVRVIGDRFPLDGVIATEGDTVAFKPKTRFSLQCPALSDIPLTTKATLFWSFGTPDAESTNVIGTLNLPDGPMEMFDLGDINCLGISMEGAVLLNNCFQDGDVRYWCHVFPANGDLIRSYADVLIENLNGDPESSNTVAIAVCVPLVIIVLGIVLFLIWKRRRRSSHYRKDKERGDYKPLDKQEPVQQLDLKNLAKKIKSFVISKLGRIPITPWVDRDDARSAPIDIVYKALDMFVNVSHEGNTVKYRLDSESGIFDDGIPELASKYVILQGRRGCGKTTFLHRLIYDWAMERERALWGSDQIVVLVPAWLLIKAKTIGEAVVECMLLKDANISAESINAHYAREKSNLTILVDDCNDKDDIDAVMKVMTDNGFLGCQLVLTTRSKELAKTAFRKFNMRHVTITGFTLRNAIEYINVVLDTADKRKKDTSEHKVVKSKAVTKPNFKQQKTEKSQTVSPPPETNESIITDTIPEKSEAPKTTAPTKKRNLHRYLEEDILQPDISCLPAVLVALCQMSIWTKGDAFKPDVTMANVFFGLVKCMFDRMKCLEVGVTEGNQLRLLTEDQLNVLAELGKVAYSRLVNSCANDADYSEEDFLSSSEKRKHALEVAKNVGLLRPLRIDSKVVSTGQCTEACCLEVSEVDIRTWFLCCTKQNVTERDPIGQGTELTHLTSHNDERVYFVLEIIEQLCVAVFFAQTNGNVRKRFEDITTIGHREILQRFSNVFQFAIESNLFDRRALVDSCAEIITKEHSLVRPLHDVPQLQELCLQQNFEGQFEGALNKKLQSIFPGGRVRFSGISSYKLRLLSYLLEYAQPKDKSKLNIKSVELLRIDRYDFPGLQENLEYLIPGKKGTKEKKPVVTKTENSQPAEKKPGITADANGLRSESSSEVHQSSVPEAHNGKEKTPLSDPKSGLGSALESRHQTKTRYSPETQPIASQPPSGPGGGDKKSDDLSHSTHSETREDGSNEVEGTESRNQDMPQFPPDELDISVLHTLQSFDLQEPLESQAGECYSSGAARDLARYLPRLEMLESLVLVGTILSSDAICDLAKSAEKLPNLKKLDLCLNRQFDDRAFVAVTNLLLRQCRKLTDLRLSLYKVTDEGFDQVEKEMRNAGEHGWGRLKTLYLLHGSPAETLVGFLSNSVTYFQSVECFHLSATYTHQQGRIQESTEENFEQNMKNPKIMPNLKYLDIGNMETLKERLASLELPKKKTGPGILNTAGTVVTDLTKKAVGGIAELVLQNTVLGENAKSVGKKTASENAESVGKKTASENAESVGKKTASENAELVGKKTASENAKLVSKKTASENAQLVGKNTTCENAESVCKETTSENAESVGKKAKSENAKSGCKKTANENAKSMNKMTANENAESVGNKTDSENAESVGKKAVNGNLKSVGEKTASENAESMGEKTASGNVKSVGKTESGNAKSVVKKTISGNLKSVEKKTARGSVKSVGQNTAELVADTIRGPVVAVAGAAAGATAYMPVDINYYSA